MGGTNDWKRIVRIKDFALGKIERVAGTRIDKIGLPRSINRRVLILWEDIDAVLKARKGRLDIRAHKHTVSAPEEPVLVPLSGNHRIDHHKRSAAKNDKWFHGSIPFELETSAGLEALTDEGQIPRLPISGNGTAPKGCSNVVRTECLSCRLRMRVHASALNSPALRLDAQGHGIDLLSEDERSSSPPMAGADEAQYSARSVATIERGAPTKMPSRGTLLKKKSVLG